jgi:hypothetical protein
MQGQQPNQEIVVGGHSGFSCAIPSAVGPSRDREAPWRRSDDRIDSIPTVHRRQRRPAVVGVLQTQEALLRAALVGLMTLGQEVERPLRGPGVSFSWLVARSLEALPVQFLFGLLPPLLPLGRGVGSPETQTVVLRASVRRHRRAQPLRWLLRSIRPKRASDRDLPPENRSSGRARVSWPPAFGGGGLAIGKG